jgi:hypothetical protein
VFHQFRQAKFDNGGSIFKLEPIFATAPAALKKSSLLLKWSKLTQNNWLENNNLNP